MDILDPLRFMDGCSCVIFKVFYKLFAHACLSYLGISADNECYIFLLIPICFYRDSSQLVLEVLEVVRLHYDVHESSLDTADVVLRVGVGLDERVVDPVGPHCLADG